jgi:hypothetical protein
MIQRIQTIWLLLAAAAAFLSLKFPFYTGEFAGQTATGYVGLTGQSTILLTILISGVGLAALISIFLYKNRKLQSRIVLLALMVSLVNLVLLFLEARDFETGKGAYSLTAALSFAVPVFLFLAMRGIRKDEKLVKSLDRLR